MTYKKAFLNLPTPGQRKIRLHITASILSSTILSYFNSDMTFHQHSLGARLSTIIPILVVVLYNLPDKAPSVLFFLLPAFPVLQVAVDLLMLIMVYAHTSVFKGMIKVLIDFLLISWSWRAWLEFLRVCRKFNL